MAEGTQKSSTAEFILRRIKADAERQRIARQKYQQEYEGGQQALSWELKNLLDSLAGLSCGEIVNGLTKLRGDLVVVQQRTPTLCVVIVGLVSQRLKLTRPEVETWLNLPLPMQHDALDTLLLDTVRERAPEARNGLLPLSLVVDAVNVGCGEGLTPKFIAHRLRAMGCVMSGRHPAFVVVIPRLLPSEANTAHTRLLPSPEAPHENGSHTQNTQ